MYKKSLLIAAILSTLFSIVSPKILGMATTKLFEGIVAKVRHAPGAAVDFGYIMNILLLLAALYVISAGFNFVQQYIMAGVAQKTVYQLRRQVEDKLTRLPLKFFDSRTHGEILAWLPVTCRRHIFSLLPLVLFSKHAYDRRHSISKRQADAQYRSPERDTGGAAHTTSSPPGAEKKA